MNSATPMNLEQFQQEILNTTLPVMVDFYGTGCPPCMALSPVIDRLSRDYDGQACIVKVNVNEQYQLAMHYNITVVPSLLFFRNGHEIGRLIGLLPEWELRQQLDAMIAQSAQHTMT